MIPRTEASPLTPGRVIAATGERAPRPKWRARLLARLCGGSLDRALVAGADPSRSSLLAARAWLLTSRRHRQQTAQTLDRLVCAAQGLQRRWWDLSQREAVLDNTSELHGLAMVLSGERPVYAAGLARLERLLVDGTGPVYHGGTGDLARALAEVRRALDGA